MAVKAMHTICIHVIVIPWVVRLYVEIIHEPKRVDYLAYRRTGGQTWYNYFIPPTSVKTLHITRYFMLKMVWVV